MSKMKIYACGGAGLNVGKQFAQWNGKENTGFAKIETVFIDTSRSNVDASIPADQIYLVDDLDGSGKLRSTNYTKLSESANEILHEHRPGDYNVVLHSGGGGSGSVIGPLLVSELLSRGELVLVVMIGSTASRIETENTSKTLKSYEAISQKRKMPVNVLYRENSTSKPRSRVDVEIAEAITLMTAVFSGQNRELDKEDIVNFLNYHKGTSYSARLAFLDFFSTTIDLQRGQALVSLLTLAEEGGSTEVDHLNEYQATGFLHEQAAKALGRVKPPLHMAVIAGAFNAIDEDLKKKIASYEEARSVVHDKGIVGKDTSSTDEGLVL